MAIDDQDLRKVSAEYEVWIESKEYETLALPPASTEEGKNKHREAFIQYLSESGKTYPTFDPKKDGAANQTVLNELVDTKSNAGALNQAMNFMGDNKIAFGGMVLALIAALSTGVGAVATVLMTGAAFMAGSLIGDEDGIVGNLLGTNKPAAPSKVRFLENDAANLPMMPDLKSIGEVGEEFHKHADIKKLIDADNKPSAETNTVTTLDIKGHKIIAYGEQVGGEMHVTHISLGETQDGKTIIQPVPKGVGDIKLEIVGDQVELNEASARAIAGAHDNLIAAAQGKPQMADVILPVTDKTTTEQSLKKGDRLVIQVKDGEDVVGKVQGDVIEVDGKLRFKAIAAVGFDNDTPEPIASDAALKQLVNYRELQLTDDGKLDVGALSDMMRQQRSDEREKPITDPERMELQVNLQAMKAEGGKYTLQGKYHNDVTFSQEVAGTLVSDPTGFFTVETKPKTFEITSEVKGSGKDQKLVIASGSTVKIAGNEFKVGDKDIILDIPELDMNKPESLQIIGDKLKANTKIQELMQEKRDDSGRGLANNSNGIGSKLPTNLTNPDLIQPSGPNRFA
jgi:hypothetical protein